MTPLRLTGAQVRAGAESLPAFLAALHRIIDKSATVADDELVADDIIIAAFALEPGAAAFQAVATAAANAIIEGVWSGRITPGFGQNRDPLGRGGRRG